MFRQDYTCPALLVADLVPHQYSSLVIDLSFRVRGYHPLRPDFPDSSTNSRRLTPTGLVPVRSPLLRESRLMSFPPVTEMFQFTGFAFPTYEFSEE